jgi:hypothetical protein
VLPWQGQIKELDVLGLDVDDLAEHTDVETTPGDGRDAVDVRRVTVEVWHRSIHRGLPTTQPDSAGCRTPGGAEGMRVRVLGAVGIATADGDPPLARWPRVRRLLAVLLVHQG